LKIVIFAGGLGTRLMEETGLRPKPMVEIGGRPILWHLMKVYSFYGFKEFIILTGYLSHVIKDYFVNYYTRYSDITVDLECNTVTLNHPRVEPWKVTMLYTGELAMTGARLKKAEPYLKDEPFMLTYGDGLADINLPSLLESHKESGKLCTLTAVRPAGKWGKLALDNQGAITSFQEKPQGDGNWINGGFMVCDPDVFSYLPPDDDGLVFEQSPLQRLAADRQLGAFKHAGFWRAMDTLKDKSDLTALWTARKAPWALWEPEWRNK